jgi:hypothetical protein
MDMTREDLETNAAAFEAASGRADAFLDLS